MTVFIECPGCAKRYEVTQQHLGRMVLCSNARCRRPFVAAAVPAEPEPLAVPGTVHHFVFDGGTMTADDLPGVSVLELELDCIFDVHDVGQQPFAVGIG
ncbi:hypothetical protein [Schlesneria paludicola]|uniref:hypothetical protein n=1 Tax=Schlesneria paludicola TaxID=360056 RepID=UPI00029AB159|nr:hypothetical protein [Schlesneria paludicola]